MDYALPKKYLCTLYQMSTVILLRDSTPLREEDNVTYSVRGWNIESDIADPFLLNIAATY